MVFAIKVSDTHACEVDPTLSPFAGSPAEPAPEHPKTAAPHKDNNNPAKDPGSRALRCDFIPRFLSGSADHAWLAQHAPSKDAPGAPRSVRAPLRVEQHHGLRA